MNVCLQSLFACPAFFNMLVAIANEPEFEEKLDDEGLLKPLVDTAKYFDAKN